MNQRELKQKERALKVQNNSGIRPTCGNCYFVTKKERCKIVRMYDEFEVNPLAKRLEEERPAGKVDICRYYQPIESLKNLIDYKLI